MNSLPEVLVRELGKYLDEKDYHNYVFTGQTIMFPNWDNYAQYEAPDKSEEMPESLYDPGKLPNDFVVPVKTKKTRHAKTRRRRKCNLNCHNVLWHEMCDECAYEYDKIYKSIYMDEYYEYLDEDYADYYGIYEY